MRDTASGRSHPTILPQSLIPILEPPKPPKPFKPLKSPRPMDISHEIPPAQRHADAVSLASHSGSPSDEVGNGDRRERLEHGSLRLDQSKSSGG